MSEHFEKLLRRSKSNWEQLGQKPWIRLGTGLFGEAVGALQVIEKVRSVIEAKNLDVTVSEVGTSGLCYAEPLLDIQL